MNKDAYDKLTWSSKIHIILSDLRVFPRIAIVLYGFMCYQSYEWFTSLPDPTNAQSAFVTILWSASAAWFNFYVSTTNITQKTDE